VDTQLVHRTAAKSEHAKEAGLGQCSARPKPMTQAGEALQPPCRRTNYFDEEESAKN
jgi:hypothetical protein